MARWSQRTFDLETDAYVIPAVNSDWYNTGAWGTYVGLNPHRLAKKIPGRTPYNLKINLYAPEVKFELSRGEVEKISQNIEQIMDNYAYQLEHAEIIGRDYRKMFSGTLIAYIIALVTAQGWWFIWFRQPFHAMVGVDNWFKNRQAKKIPRYVARELTIGTGDAKKEAINEIYRFYQGQKGRYLEICQRMRNFCRSRKKENWVFEQIEEAYRDVIQADLEDSYLTKLVAHTFPQKVLRFFLGDMVLMPKIKIPRILVPARDLDYNLSRHFPEGARQWQR